MFEKFDKDLFFYANRYDIDNSYTKLKTAHAKRVADSMLELAVQLSLNEQMTKMAYCIGIFHDIGRYKQARMAKDIKSFESIDHGDLGAEEIVKTDYLKEFSNEDVQKIVTAIKQHNKYSIENVTDSDTLLLCKMIRDCDKRDIFRVMVEERFEDVFGGSIKDLSTDNIQDCILEAVCQHKLVEVQNIQYTIERIVRLLATVFDINFKSTLVGILNDGYYRYWFKRRGDLKTETAKRFDIIIKEIEDYISVRDDTFL